MLRNTLAPRPDGEPIKLVESADLDQALIDTDNPLPRFQSILQQASNTLKDLFLDEVSVVDLVHARCELVDQVLLRAWRMFIPPQADDIALVAVGGYGRKELHPGSDIDLLILLKEKDTSPYRSSIEQLLAFLWDIGLEVGHSVRSLQECIAEATQDITIATNLLESRLLTGPTDLYQRMREHTGPEFIWPSNRFFEAKLEEQKSRHRKYHDTSYNLEPNVKEGPGGLRDLQMIAWVAKRHFGAESLRELVTHGFLTENEYTSLTEARNFLWRVRFALHIQTGRREDRLLFDHQQALATTFGYRDEGHRLAVEQFMKEYYRTIMELNRLNEMLLQLFQEAILYADKASELESINKRFRACNGYIEVTAEDIFRRYPFALLEIFLIMEQYQGLKGVRASTIRLIRNHRHLIDNKFRNDLRCRSLFIEILKQPRGVTHELRRMNRYGILAAYLPAFEMIVGQMQYDLFHVYTVDEHTLMVLRNLRRFTVPEFANELPRCTKISQQIPKPEILYLGALFHDIAKGRGGDHSELGALEAMNFCLHHGLSQYDAKFVTWLVKSHLVMSKTAQRKDISDPEVVSEFAELVGDQVHLDYLYLLTVADIRGTDPNLWNTWKDSLLTELYTSTSRVFRRGLANPIDREELVTETQEAARKLLKSKAYEEDALDKAWQRLDDDYFLGHTPDEIAWHTQGILDSLHSDLPLILVREETERGGTEIFLYTTDQDYLFAMTTMALDQLGLNIVDARVITTRDGYTLDTYIVLDSAGETIHNAFRIQDIITKLKKALTQPETRPMRITRRPSRQLKHFSIPTEITFSSDKNDMRTIMELTTADRPGLLARVGQALVGCNVKVHNAKIATFGARVEDVFFISDNDNQPLSTEEQHDALRKALIERLEEGQ